MKGVHKKYISQTTLAEGQLDGLSMAFFIFVERAMDISAPRLSSAHGTRQEKRRAAESGLPECHDPSQNAASEKDMHPLGEHFQVLWHTHAMRR